MAGLPYAVPSNYVIRLVEEGSLAHSAAQQAAAAGPRTHEPVQPHPSHPSHFQFPRTSLHEMTLRTHFRGPHAPGSVSAPKSGTSWAPATDIRETMRAYHIEVETPGVTEKDSILIQWMSPHTLMVQGESKRPANIGLLDSEEGKRIWEGEGDGWPKEAGHGKMEQKEPTDGGPLMRTPSRETMEAELMTDAIPTVLLTERKIGPWRRTFTLPDDVEMKELKARLEGGLLRIDLPKKSVEDVKGGGIRIEIE
ncbi:uncharacterized protein Z518_02726 [Rhinocladiella mackenziei CBS 650.93]|uniref:SHSP domain-containing protein n=1 Tax=Rhinocladiella mackenziei CBS 650.93 TaxID=1442369 RepID=A0A0D2IXK8_9EURO|nr:uncharacterized protein Z518_02726 [Rhinocladiella mackenziei CBS 650.93]KIX08071.1 hypothetical protein Z518_02726 [Rhinocladiella mackenziei CBS 650.93]